MLGLGRRQGLGEGVGLHVIHGAGRGADGSRFNDLVMVHVDVLGLWEVLVVARGRDGCW